MYIEIYDIQLHLQYFKWANDNWMAGRIWPTGRGLDIVALELNSHWRILCAIGQVACYIHILRTADASTAIKFAKLRNF